MSKDNLDSFTLPAEISDPNSTKNPASANYVYYPEHPQNEFLADLETRPRRYPLPPFDPFYVATFGLIGSSHSKYRKISDSILQQQSRLIPRPLTRSEHMILKAYHGNAIALIAWGQLLGGLYGAGRAYQTTATQTLPFDSAFRSIFGALRIPYPNRTPPVQGPMPPPPFPVGPNDRLYFLNLSALKPQNILRYMLWIVTGRAVAGVFVNVLAAGYARSALTRDERLQEFYKDEKAFVGEKVQEIQEKREAQRSGLPGPSAPRVQTRAAPQPQPRAGRYGDAEDDTQSLGGVLADETIFLSDDNAPDDAPAPRIESSYSTRSNPTYPPQNASSPARPGANDTQQSFSISEPSVSSEPQTAWEKIRQGQKNRPMEAPSKGAWANRQAETNDDSFSFSNADRDRQLAKEEAQREFDAKLDQERRGEGGWK